MDKWKIIQLLDIRESKITEVMEKVVRRDKDSVMNNSFCAPVFDMQTGYKTEIQWNNHRFQELEVWAEYNLTLSYIAKCVRDALCAEISSL